MAVSTRLIVADPASFASVGSGATTFAAVAGAITVNATEANRTVNFRTAGTLSRMTCYKAFGNRGGMTLTTRIAGADGTLTLAFSSTNGEYEDSTHSDAVTTGQAVGFKLVSSTGGNTNLSLAYVGLNWAATGDTVNLLASIGALALSTASQTSYVVPCGFLLNSTTQAEGEWLVKLPAGVSSVTLRNLYVRVSANTSTNSITISVNGATGAGTAPSVTFAGGSGAGVQEDTTHSIAANDGDKISFKIVTGASTVACTVQVISFEVQSGDNLFHFVAGSAAGVTMTAAGAIAQAGGLARQATEGVGQQKLGVTSTPITLSLLSAYVKTAGTGSDIDARANAADSGTPGKMTVATTSTGWKTDSTDTDSAADTDLLNYQTAGSVAAVVTCIAITVQETPASTTKTGSDTTAVTVTDATRLTATPKLSESLAVVLSEVAKGLGSPQAGDTLPVALAELASTRASLRAADTLPVGLAELSRVSIRLLVADTVAVVIAESSLAPRALLRGQDTLAIAAAEAQRLTAQLTGPETLAVTLGEAQSLRAQLFVAEALGIGLSEAQRLAISIRATDAVAVVIAESQLAPRALLRAQDSLPVALSEAGPLRVLVLSADPLPVRLTDTPRTILARLTTAEALPVVLADLATLRASLRGADVLAVGLAEATHSAVLLRALDTLGIGLSEAIRIVDLIRAFEALGVGLAERGSISASVRAAEGLSVAVGEATRLSARLQALEALGVAIQDAESLLVRLRGAEALAVALGEAGRAALLRLATDDLAVALLEHGDILAIAALPGICPGGLRNRTATLALRGGPALGLGLATAALGVAGRTAQTMPAMRRWPLTIAARC